MKRASPSTRTDSFVYMHTICVGLTIWVWFYVYVFFCIHFPVQTIVFQVIYCSCDVCICIQYILVPFFSLLKNYQICELTHSHLVYSLVLPFLTVMLQCLWLFPQRPNGVGFDCKMYNHHNNHNKSNKNTHMD